MVQRTCSGELQSWKSQYTNLTRLRGGREMYSNIVNPTPCHTLRPLPRPLCPIHRRTNPLRPRLHRNSPTPTPRTKLISCIPIQERPSLCKNRRCPIPPPLASASIPMPCHHIPTPHLKPVPPLNKKPKLTFRHHNPQLQSLL